MSSGSGSLGLQVPHPSGSVCPELRNLQRSFPQTAESPSFLLFLQGPWSDGTYASGSVEKVKMVSRLIPELAGLSSNMSFNMYWCSFSSYMGCHSLVIHAPKNCWLMFCKLEHSKSYREVHCLEGLCGQSFLKVTNSLVS